MNSPRAACGVTPRGALLVARQSRFHGSLIKDMLLTVATR
jgi:hypothetical protein